MAGTYWISFIGIGSNPYLYSDGSGQEIYKLFGSTEFSPLGGSLGFAFKPIADPLTIDLAMLLNGFFDPRFFAYRGRRSDLPLQPAAGVFTNDGEHSIVQLLFSP